MSSSTVREELSAFIEKHKKLMNIGLVYREFNSKWLDEFDDVESVESVLIEYKCVYYERIYGDDDDSTKMVITEFLEALEALLIK
jgi:hypothetical protein